MKTAAIIAEYNPFHNGHSFHIGETKKLCDCVVVLMSGSFVQRGEPSVFSKWQRARTAIENGADLVIELPCFYATGSSPDFAAGAVKILNKCGVIDLLSFGSESGDISMLSKTAEVLTDEPKEFKDNLLGLQKQGLSFPRARELALSELGITPALPNDMLATEYLRALIFTHSEITPMCVRRSVAHDSTTVTDTFSSASHIREMMKSGADISAYIPKQEKAVPLFYSDLGKMIMYSVLSSDKQNHSVRSASDRELLSAIHLARCAEDINSYLYNIKTKRYTMSRVKRTLLHILLNCGEIIPDFEPYLRVLALNNTGSSLIKKIKGSSDIKIINKVSKSYATENAGLALDIYSTDIRSIASGEATGQDFVNSPIKL